MSKRIRFLSISGFLIFTSVAFAQYTMELTGVGDGVTSNGVYVSPYQGTISQNGSQIYSGYIICDDYTTESTLYTPWTASATNAGSLDGSEKFTTSSSGHSVQENYDAVAWLANRLLLASNVNNAAAQINYSFAIWDIFDGATTDPGGAALSLIQQAFDAVAGGYVGTNVTVFTPNPHSASQEFLVVNGPPIATPEPSSVALLGLDLLTALAMIFLLRRRWART